LFFLFKLIKRLISFALLIAIILPLYAAGNVWYTATHTKPVKSDAIVVLGAAQFDGRPSDVLKARLVEAKRIYDLGLASRIITVGAGQPGDRTTEAASGYNWLKANGVAKRFIDSVPLGTDTLNSTRAYITDMRVRNLKSAIIVTDQYHCLRAMTMARDFKITTSCAPTKTGPASTKSSSFRYLVRETGAYLAYVTVGRHGIHLTDQIKN
jgi:uncharacterized SAM-binding protein YcdF (DUF218 family)